MEKISNSVGRDGTNSKPDVIIVQTLLNHSRIPGIKDPIKVDGLIGNQSIARIEAFQKDIVAMAAPDGRVDPGGKTFIKLSMARANAMAANSFEPSGKAIDLLKSIEQLATSPYDDQTGLDITEWVKGATIGYGHLISKTEWPTYKNGVSEKDAIKLFKTDLAPFVKTIQQNVTASITQNEFDAMVIFTFNIGSKGFRTSSALKLINDPAAETNYPDLESAWKAWNKSEGKINKGVINRRNAEWDIYTKGIYERW